MSITFLADQPELRTSYRNQQLLAIRELGGLTHCLHGVPLYDGCKLCHTSGCVLLSNKPVTTEYDVDHDLIMAVDSTRPIKVVTTVTKTTTNVLGKEEKQIIATSSTPIPRAMDPATIAERDKRRKSRQERSELIDALTRELYHQRTQSAQPMTDERWANVKEKFKTSVVVCSEDIIESLDHGYDES